MKKIILLMLLLFGFGYATKYEIVHIKKGRALNVRDTPSLRDSVVVGRLAAYTTNISVKECLEDRRGDEWCYINAPKGGSHIEGWVNSYYLAPMAKTSKFSWLHIQNFLRNFYLADEEDFLDKLQVFYAFPMQRYFNSRNVSLMELRQKKVRFYKRWPKRNYRFTYLKILKRKPKYVDVQTTVRWRVEGHGDYQEGKDIQKLRLVPSGNSFKVLAIKYLRHIVYPKPKPIVDENITEENNTTVLSPIDKIVKETFDGKKYYIKAGSFFSEINKNYLTTISKNGFSYIIQKVRQDNKIIRRVFIGPFYSEEATIEALKVVRAKINGQAYIQTIIH